MDIFILSRIEKQFIQSLQQREYQAEGTINKIRLGIVLVLVAIDLIAFLFAGLPIQQRYWIVYALIVLLMTVYCKFVNRVTASGTYHRWLKYTVSTIDFTILSLMFLEMHTYEFIQLFMPETTVAMIFILFAMQLILINSLRYGTLIMVYNIVLGLGIGVWMIYTCSQSIILSIYVAVFFLITGILAAWISGSITRTYVHLIKRERLCRYLPDEVVGGIDSGEIALQLGGEKRTITVLFADIRGFTQISERMDPAEVVSMLNTYFTEMTGIVKAHSGMVDKYIGDAIMAVFGLPVYKGDEELQAIIAAIAMQERVKKLNSRFAQNGFPSISMGIAVHTGVALAGNIGSSERMEYTVIGDTVNVTSRIEALNKQYHTSILFTESTRDKIKHKIKAEFVAEATLRGRDQPIRLYTVSSTQALYGQLDKLTSVLQAHSLSFTHNIY